MAGVSSGLAATTPKAKGQISKGKTIHQNQGLKLIKNEGKISKGKSLHQDQGLKLIKKKGKSLYPRFNTALSLINGIDLITKTNPRFSVATWNDGSRRFSKGRSTLSM